MTEVRQKWIQAGVLLAKERNARVECPTCGIGILEVSDQSHPDELGVVDRYLTCPSCGAREVLVRLRAI